jgi:hypothetical protein
VANDLTAVLNFCASYGNGTSSSATAIGTGAAVSTTGTSTTTATTVKVTTGSSTATAVFTSDGNAMLYTKVSLMTAMAAAMIVSVYML